MPKGSPEKTDIDHARACEDAAFSILDLFLRALAREAETHGGTLTRSRIDALAAQFKAEDATDVRLEFHALFEACLRRRRLEFADGKRRRPFDRVLVHRIDHLFPAPGQLDENPETISRRVLPGVFQALNLMSGADLIEQCHIACIDILKVQERASGRVRWDDFYQNEGTNQLADDVIAASAAHFEDFQKRIAWLLTLINDHLAPPDTFDFEGEGVRDWTLDRAGLIALLRGMFASFKDRLASDAGRLQLDRRYGEEGRRLLDQVVRTLDAADE